MDEDYQLALALQEQFNEEEPVVTDIKRKGKENKPTSVKNESSLVDPHWEFIDPTPDIHVLFMQFNARFFWSKLHGVEVKWSPRMTSCAGVCVYQGRSGFCSVRLSLPLLKLRPRKDLVETLLHEMIHAFLFVTNNNRDRDGHGPEFHSHMNRINREAGTRITVYHSFHDEVRLYQQHWWRCNGPCQKRPPFFGMVRRAMNRAPGPADNWWAQHEATCGGKFIKVREPENMKKKSADSRKKPSVVNSVGKGDIRSFFPAASAQDASSSKVTSPSYSGSNSSGLPQPGLLRKPTMNNVHGFGGGQSSVVKPIVNPAVNNVFGFGDLHGQRKSKPSGSSHQPNGKGYILGGSRKPPVYKGGAYGGILSNKGSGTLVVSGSSKKVKDSQGTSSSVPIEVFSGSGHLLGNGSTDSTGTNAHSPQAGRLNPFQKNVPVFTNKPGGSTLLLETSKRSSFNFLNEPQPKKKPLDISSRDGDSSSPSQPNKVSCPVCQQQVLESVINSHLDDCISNLSKPECKSEVAPTVKSCDSVIVLSDSEDECNEIGAEVNCPGCNERISNSLLHSHLSLCVSSSFEKDDNDVTNVQKDSSNNVKCPICCESFLVADMDRHLDNCASCSVQDLSGVFDENFSDEEEDAAVGSPSKQVSESGERLYPCPCCLILIETSKMNEHLDLCVV